MLNYFFMLLGWIFILFGLQIAHPAIADPFVWTSVQNGIYMSIVRTSFNFAIVATIIPVMTGNAELYKAVLTGPVILSVAKGCFIIALIHPIVINLLYDTG